MSWLWLNIPLMAVVSLAVAGIPMWLVLRRPEPEPQLQAQPLPETIAARYDSARADTRPLTRREVALITSADEAWLDEQAAARR